MYHVFFECEVARAIWELIEGRFAGIRIELNRVGLDRVPRNGQNNYSSTGLALCLNALYPLWMARNQVVFQNYHPPVETLLSSFLALTIHYADITLFEGNQMLTSSTSAHSPLSSTHPTTSVSPASLMPGSVASSSFYPLISTSSSTTNFLFAERLIELLNLDENFVWIHDYHLLAAPTFLRRRSPRVKLEFFLHSPFPSFEIFRTIPVRDELLRALLNRDLSKRGYIGIEYYGRTVTDKILPVGIDLGQLESVISSYRLEVLGDEAAGGAFEIKGAARSQGRDVQEVQREAHSITRRINVRFGELGYEPIVLIMLFGEMNIVRTTMAELT
ncbi:hypothetical protein Cni_G06534 [Canna indica]|uniref:Trehalose-6-phosphate synthase n=1 Tax=Canna indica TaxID=4628 RepID=A0AAQ3K0F5_9LILI|nr:hypothetical protein Cni_G06534 [Canna indica]